MTIRRTISAVLAAALATGALVVPAASAMTAGDPPTAAQAPDMRASVATALAEERPAPAAPAPAADTGIDLTGLAIGVTAALLVSGAAVATVRMPRRRVGA